MKRILVGVLASGVLLLFGGCGENLADNGAGAASGLGTMVVRLVDAPAAYQAINIFVDSVRVHFESGDTVSGWYTISRSPAVYNLLAYAQGRDTIIAEGAIPAGYYSQMRLFIGSGSYIVTDGVSNPLEIPSGSQSGLKLNIQANIVAGVKYELMLDFDAGQSIVVTGNGRYKLKPVIKVVSTAISGSMSGEVQPDTTHPVLWAISGTDTTTTSADTAGFFKFRYLTPGMYLLKVVPADTTFLTTSLPNISVTAAVNTDVGLITLHKK